MAPPQGLDFQLVDVQFTQGLDTRTQKKLRLPGKWQVLENLTLTEEYTPKRRDGMEALVATASGNGLATYNGQLLLVAGNDVSAVTEAVAPAIQTAGRYAYVDVEVSSVRRSTGMQDSPDCATGNGVTVYVWRVLDATGTATGIQASVVDEATGSFFRSDFSVSATGDEICPRVVYVDDGTNKAFLIFYIDDNANTLVCYPIDATAPATPGAPVTLISDPNLATINFDACACGPTGFAVAMVSYGWADGTTSLRSIGVLWDGLAPSVLLGPTNLISNVEVDISDLIAIATLNALNGTGFTFVVAAAGASALQGTVEVGLNATTWVRNIAPALIDASPPPGGAFPTHVTACINNTNEIYVFTDPQWAFSQGFLNAIVATVVTPTGVVASPATPITPSATYDIVSTDCHSPQGPFICGKAFSDGSNAPRILLPVCTMENYQAASNVVTNNQQNAFFLLSYTLNDVAADVVARALYGTFGCTSSGFSLPACSSPCSVVAVGSFDYAMVAPRRTLLDFENGINVSPTGLCRLDLLPNTKVLGHAPIKAQLGQTTYLAGGALTAYDGQSTGEQGFFLFPEGIRVTNVATGGSLTAGVHQVCAIYEWVDNAGQRHQSAPSPAVSVTSAANDHLTVIVPTLLLTAKTGVNIVLYMTQAGGLTFNRVTSVFAPLLNTKAAREVSSSITASDASILGNELLYSQPNQAATTLPNNSPPPCTALAVHQNRLVTNDGDNPSAYIFSQPYVTGVGLQFNEVLGGLVDVSGGKIIGISELDEKVVFLCERKLFAVFGTGPNAAGAFNNYSEPQEIPSDVGCSEARSILRMPMGIIFKSPKGWYLLGRDLSVKYIGAAVAEWDSATVTSAVMLEDRQECRFSASFTAESAATGYAFVYSYAQDQWSVFSQAAQAYVIKDAVFWKTTGLYTHTSDGYGLNQDTPGTFLDSPGVADPAGIVTTGQTAWLKASSLANYQRVRWLYLTMTAPGFGSSGGPKSSFQIVVRFNDSDSGLELGSYQVTINLAAITFNTVIVDLRHKLRHQKCKSVSFRFVETPVFVDGVLQSSLSGMQAMTLQVGLKRGTNKLPPAQTV